MRINTLGVLLLVFLCNSAQPLKFETTGAMASPLTSGWGVCWASKTEALSNAGSNVGGPFTTQGAPPASPQTKRSMVVSHVFQWSGSTSGFPAQFDAFLAQQNLPPPLANLGSSIQIDPSQCDFESTSQNVLANPVISETDWPNADWPQGSPPQGWGFCFVEPVGGTRNLYYAADFKWIGDQNAYRNNFANYIATSYKMSFQAAAAAETCTFVTVVWDFQTVADDKILSARENESMKATQRGWNIVNASWP